MGAGTMSSLQSLRELISERLAAAAEEICRLCEGTIVQYEEELCRQRRLLDVIWKPQLQLHHIGLPQHWLTEEDSLCNPQRNFRLEPEEPVLRVQLELKMGAGTMSSLQSLRELISQRLAAAADEICRLCEGTIVQYEEELCRQRRLLDVIWKPQLQLHHIGLPQHWMTEEEDLCNQQRNFRVEQEEPEPPQIKEEQEEPEPPQIQEEQEEPEPPQIQEEQEEPELPQIKEEQEEPEPPQIKEEPGELCISQDEDQLDLKQETDTLMEIPTYEEDEKSEADLNNQQSFNVTDSQDEEGNQHEESTSTTDEETESSSTTDEETESTSTTDEETEPQNRDQRKRRDRSHVQSVDSSHMSAALPQCWMTEEEDLCIQQRNFRVEHEEAEPPQIKEEPGELCISQDEEQIDLKQETDTLMEIPTYEEDEKSEADLNNQQSFNVTDSQDEERNQHEESTSTTDGETDPQNRDQRKRRHRRHVQSVDSSHMSESQCDTDVRKNLKKTNLGKKYKQSPIRSGKNSRIITNPSDYMETGSDERCYICKECGKSFCNTSLFRIHTRIHAEDKRFSCKECEKRFFHRSHLKQHMRTHTGEKPFSCKECKKCFSQISNLKTHMRTHTGEKPFSCKECKKFFSQKSTLKSHMKTHTGERPFSCKECKKSFSQIFHLQRHMRTHTGEKPFSCKECNKSFSCSSSLKTHMRIHTGEKPFSCKECKKSFSRIFFLQTHMRTHTGEKPFSCKECKKSFSRVCHLNKHMRTCKTFS
ncbi:uncharacterized protein LOC144989080 [Oryzias latipes]